MILVDCLTSILLLVVKLGINAMSLISKTNNSLIASNFDSRIDGDQLESLEVGTKTTLDDLRPNKKPPAKPPLSNLRDPQFNLNKVVDEINNELDPETIILATKLPVKFGLGNEVTVKRQLTNPQAQSLTLNVDRSINLGELDLGITGGIEFNGVAGNTSIVDPVLSAKTKIKSNVFGLEGKVQVGLSDHKVTLYLLKEGVFNVGVNLATGAVTPELNLPDVNLFGLEVKPKISLDPETGNTKINAEIKPVGVNIEYNTKGDYKVNVANFRF
jgi:hypothetical protein